MKNVFKWWGIGLTLIIVVQVISVIALKSLGIEGNHDSERRTQEILVNPGLILIALLIAPVVEEFIFRYLIYRKNLKHPFGLLSAVFSSVLFGWLHGHTLALTIPLILNGLIYCLIYYKSGRILTSILAHISYNSLLFILIILNS